MVFSTHDMSVAERLCDRIFMIFRGRKVLDGTLDEIQSTYGHDTIRLRTEAGPGCPRAGSTGIEEINDQGNLQEVRWRGDPQELLAALMGRTRILPVRDRAAVAARHLRPDRHARTAETAPEAIAHAS